MPIGQLGHSGHHAKVARNPGSGTEHALKKQMLENNVQTALSAGLIDLEDAIDIREIKNIKLANQQLTATVG